MKRLNRFLVKSYIGPFIAAFFITEFILLMQFLWKYIDDLVGKGLGIMVIAKLFAYISAGLVPMAMPIAVLLSSIMTFGNLGENYELTAMKSSGISLLKIMFPLIIFNFMISFSSYLFYNDIMPYTNLKARSLLYDIRQQRLDISIKGGIFYNGIDNYSIKVGRKNIDNGMLYNMMIYDHTERKGNINVTLADSGYIKMTPDKQYLILKLYNGRKYINVKEDNEKHRHYKTYPHEKHTFDEETVTMRLKGFGLKRTDEQLWKEHFEMMNTKQLKKASDSLTKALETNKIKFAHNLIKTNYFKKEKKNDSTRAQIDYSKLKVINVDSIYNSKNKTERIDIIKRAINYARSAKTYIHTSNEEFKSRRKWIVRHDVEYYKKYAVPVACFILFFIGAPLGAIIRKGGLGWPVLISVFFFVLYYVISMISEKSVKEGLLPAFEGVWLASAVLLPIGVFLTYKSNNDSVIFNVDTYFEPIKKLFKKLKRK